MSFFREVMMMYFGVMNNFELVNLSNKNVKSQQFIILIALAVFLGRNILVLILQSSKLHKKLLLVIINFDRRRCIF